MKTKIDPILQKFNRIFSENGFEAYLVGGAVRDIFLKKTASDWDVATNATPEDVMRMFRFVVPTGIAHGTVTVHFMKKEIEVTTFRTESDYSDGRHPDKVSYAATIEEDLSRRDFTMNAIAVDLRDGGIVDPFGGKDDIKKKIIRTVGKASERFMEDGLRPIRALRFASQLQFSIEKDTYSQILEQQIQRKILSISIERFRDEFNKMLKSEKPSIGLKLMEETGIMELFLPEFKPCRGCVQSDGRGFHDFDVLDHLFYACDGAPRENLTVRLAALFHDIAKPLVKEEKKISGKNATEDLSGKTIEKQIGNIGAEAEKTPLENEKYYMEETLLTFYNHDIEGAKIIEKTMRRLKYPNDEIEKVSRLVRLHMFNYEPNWSDAAVRRFIVRAGKENIDDLFDLRIADVYGMHNAPVQARNSPATARLIEFKERIENVLEKASALSLRDLAVNGNDLIALGIPPGKQIGKILKELFDCVLEDPGMNEKATLLNVAKKISGI